MLFLDETRHDVRDRNRWESSCDHVALVLDAYRLPRPRAPGASEVLVQFWPTPILRSRFSLSPVATPAWTQRCTLMSHLYLPDTLPEAISPGIRHRDITAAAPERVERSNVTVDRSNEVL